MIKLVFTPRSKRCVAVVALLLTASGVVGSEDDTAGIVGRQLLGAVKSGNVDQMVNTALNAVTDETTSTAQHFLLDLFPTAEVQARVSDSYGVEGSVLLLKPIFESDDHSNLLFTQGSVHRYNKRTTVNVGIGLRHLTLDKKLLVGLNGFFDHELPYDHQRTSIGAEIRTTVGEINANYYRGLSGWNQGRNGNHERAMDGFDIELGIPLPYMPRTRLYGGYFEWEAQSGSFQDHGWKASVEAELYKGFYVEAGHRNVEAGQPDAAFVNIRINVLDLLTDRKKGKPFFSDVAYKLDSMEERRYEKVRRENLIRKETRQNANFTVTVAGF